MDAPNNNITTIFTTISQGKTHIAADGQVIGSVDSYNYCWTQFFAWLLGWSISVDFDGKERSVSKSEYTKLICNLTQQKEIADIYQYRVFRPVAEGATLSERVVRMRDVISAEDRLTLFKKLAIAISKGETERARLLIGKGADLDNAYYDRGDRVGPSFDKDTDGLKEETAYEFTVFLAPPVMQAARKGNWEICQFLRDMGANLAPANARQYDFERRITGFSNKLEVERTVRVDGKLDVQVRDKKVANTRDSTSGNEYYTMDDSFNLSVV